MSAVDYSRRGQLQELKELREQVASLQARADVRMMPPFEEDPDDPPAAKALHTSGGGGNSPPVADTELKTRVDWLYTLIPWIIGLLVTIFLAVVVSTATINGRIDKVGETASSLNREVGTTGVKLDETNRRLDRIDRRLEQMSEKLK